MMTLRQLAAEPPTLPTRTAWYLADLGEARGKQELFTRQSPQKLKVLREHALIESAISSNRIEGVEVDKSRVGTLIFGKPALRDRDEEEVRGYRDALKLIHEQRREASHLRSHHQTAPQALSGRNLGCRRLQGKGRGHHPDLRRWPQPRPIQDRPCEANAQAMAEMVELWQRGLREKWVHPLVLAAALNLDFLCIHPFRDGNGRVSRLLFLLACYHCGIGSGPLHQPGTHHRGQQGALLRSPRTMFPTLARRQTRPVAGDEFPALHPDAGVQGI